MITIYEKFRNSSLDLSALGLRDQAQECSAPADASVLAWLVGSPICFCQMPAMGDTVFAANPEALPEEQLLPVAKDILGFIGLLVRCKDALLIAGAHQWSSIRFRERMAAITPGMKARSVIRALENIYHPPVIDDPAAMMLQLRREFDHMAPSRESSWKVGFETDFSETRFKGQSGKELKLDKQLTQQEKTWHVPAVYLCEDGIVADVFLEVSVDRLADFHSKWDDRHETSLSVTDKLQRQLDDPLTAAVDSILTVNDKPLPCKRSFTAIWNPMDDNLPHVRRILNHYQLNPDCGYLFKRYCFLRKGKHPQIRSMTLTLEAVPVPVPEDSFTVQEAGMRFRFTHPSTGLEHIFTVLSMNKEALNPNFLSNHPCYYTRLTYTLEPSISPDNFRIVDQEPGDWWEGYQDDPAAVIYADRKPDPGRYALSALHYEPKDQIHWRMIFRRKLHRDLQLQLLP